MNFNKLLDYRWSDLPRLAGVALLYAISVKLALAYLTSDGNISIVWIPSGIGLAVLLIGGRKYWPAIFVGAFAAYVLWVGRPWLPSIFIAMSNVVEPLAGYWLLTQLRIKNTAFDVTFTHSHDYAWLVATATLVSLMAALIGVTALWLAGMIMPVMIPMGLLHWWMGNTLGIFTVTPLILVWRTAPSNWLSRQRLVETIACFGLTFLFGQVIFLDWLSKPLGTFVHGYWMFIFVTWAAIRFGRHGSMLVIGMAVLQALLGATQGVGYFAGDGSHGLEMLWLYAMLLTGIGVTLTLVMHERKQTESRIKRLTKLYAALSQCNHAIVHCTSKDALFSQICRDAVTFGNMKMAWIGMVDEASLRVNSVASYGDDKGYLSDIQISVDASHPLGHGPTGTSIREDEPFWCQDFIHDPRTAPWHERGASVGWAASASLPLHRNGVAVGAFTLYASEVDAFDEDIRKLLIEMTSDISFSLDNFAREDSRKAAEEALVASEFRWKFAIEGAGDGVWDWDIQADKITFSKQWKAILGYAESDILPTGEEWENRFHPDDKRYVAAAMQAYLDGATSAYKVECRMRCKDGSYKWILGRGMVVRRDADGKPMRMIGTSSDITQRKLAENELYIAATAFESQEGMMVTDANKIILRVNHAFTVISGYSAEEAVGQTPRLVSSGQHHKGFYASMWESINKTGGWEGEVWNRRKSGEIYPQHLIITAVKDRGGVVTNYVASLTDATESKAAAEEIQHLAFYDSLTHLPNRRLLMDRLNHALATSTRLGWGGALLYLDLDHFKTINDTCGHAIGDLLLQQVAERLTACVRAGDTVARLGGDEFVVMLEDLSKLTIEAAEQAEIIANKILTTLSQPYQLDVTMYQSTASIGVVLFGDHEHSQDELLKHADIAMYQAKKVGRNAFCFFDPYMQEVINTRVSLEVDLRKALENQQFQLYYQIQVDHFGRPLGAEALIRWLHPEQGLVSPFNFIPSAEETGLILPIGQWVLDTACTQLKLWEQNARTRELSLSVNVSAKQFHQADFVAQVQATVQRHAINPTLLKLELTESMLVDNIENIITTMDTLQKTGIRFELDDFGTGYSSLQYLKRLPLYQLKIDQSFVRDIATDSSDKAIVSTIIAMAHALNLKAIAEGVETEDQRQFLLGKGCTHFQGYLFGRPVPIEQFEAALQQ
jgi:diguanylate cyclase (GGDEF)-like protein/PAS domain S-box-containing protein